MSLPTAQAKVDLVARFDRLNTLGSDVPASTDKRIAANVRDEQTLLDAGQVDAAMAIAGTSRLVTVTGPAGTGKTTLLLVARHALHEQGRNMIIVAPTRKAAAVAGREIGTAASSLHALLVDHGYRFNDDRAGRTVWARLNPGDVDPTTKTVYEGPRRYPLRARDRIVVDEAGMVDLQTANALAQLAEDSGAGIAMIGDHLQALPVGHSGAMATMQRRSGAAVELSAIYRFKDRDYAALTLRLRNPHDHAEAIEVARQLADRDHIEVIASDHESRERMVAVWLQHAARGERTALVTATNAEAQQINDRIQQERIDRGHLDPARFAVGQQGQFVLVGDIVQTRRNDTSTGVDNRATWTVTGLRADRIELTSVTDSGDRRTITREYAAEHVHLAYASTVHGIQGETVHASYVGAGVDASGLYVGMTRGRVTNLAFTIARDSDEAIERLADTMLRGQVEVSLDDARRAANRELGRAARDPSESGTDWRRSLASEIAAGEGRCRAVEDELRQIDADAAAAEASGHARGVYPLESVRRAAASRRTELAATLSVERARIADLSGRYRHRTHAATRAPDRVSVDQFTTASPTEVPGTVAGP